MSKQYAVNDPEDFDLDDVEIDLFNSSFTEPTHLYHKPLSIVSAQWIHKDGQSVSIDVLKSSAKMVVHNPESVMDGTWEYTPDDYEKMMDDVSKALQDIYTY